MSHRFAIILFFLAATASAQNCTTMPAANTQTMTNTTSTIVGNTTNNTITVTMDGPFTSGTGYVSVFPAFGPYSWGAPGNAGSYKIISGNGTNTIVLDGSATLPNPSRTNGGTTVAGTWAGRYVSDLAVIRNSARSYTFHWTTPGFNSDSWVSYSDDIDTQTVPGVGYIWKSANTAVGVTDHSITVDNLDINSPYTFTVWNNCFTGGTSDVSLSIHQPQNTIAGAANGTGGTNGLTKIMTSTPDVVAGLNIFTMPGYNNNPAVNWYMPPQDGVHQGFRTTPGGTVNFPLAFQDTTWPVAGATGDNAVTFQVDDWVAGGLFATLGRTGLFYPGPVTWTSGTQGFFLRSNGGGYGSISIQVPPTTPTSAPCGSIAGAVAVTLDGGTLPACAYPVKITGTRWWANSSYVCGQTATCGPPGTMAQTPAVNVPLVNQIWILVYNVNGLVTRGTVGPWMNPYTGTPGIPCETEANKTVDKPNGIYALAGCFNNLRGAVGFANNMYTYQGSIGTAPAANQPYGGQAANCWVNAHRSENSYITSSQPIWFYDAGFVCHQLDLLFPQAGGANNDEWEKNLLGVYWEQATYARAIDPNVFASYTATGAAIINNDPTCSAITGSVSFYCETTSIPVSGDVSAIQNGLAAGQRFRTCVMNSAAASSSPQCYAFASIAPTQTAVPQPGGTMPATPSPVYVSIQYVTSGGVHSRPGASVAVAIDATCPTSGNCSIRVPTPATTRNATAYDVYARNGPATTGPANNFYLQNINGPVPIGTDFIFGTTTNPLQTAGTYWLTADYNNAAITSVIAADNAAHTITINSNWSNDRATANSTVLVMRQLTGIPADTGTTGAKLVCNSCDFSGGIVGANTGVPLTAVVYCGVTPGDMNAPQYTLAPQRGSTINAIPDAHTITLTTPINCGPGINFEIRRRVAPPGGVRIFGWANTPYDAWKRFGNFIGADSIMWLASNTTVTGASVAHCCVFANQVAVRREAALSFLSCHRAINVYNDLALLGETTALSSQPNCQSPTGSITKLIPYNLFALVENMTGSNYGRGAPIGSFLNGLVAYAILDWWADPLMGVQQDQQFVYWVKRLADAMWPYYSMRNNYVTFCQPSWPHEWPYTGLGEDNILGTCSQANGNFSILNSDGSTNPVSDYWSIMGNLLPVYAFFYYWTGNANIGTVPGMVRAPWQPCYSPAVPSLTGVPGCGPITYGAAYNDMSNWIFVHMASTPAWTGAGAKTLGEMGIWQDRAIQWMKGSAAPSLYSLNPSIGAVGSTVTLGGMGFGATQGTSTVTFNGTTATATAWSDNSITVMVPAGATTGFVVVTVGGLTSAGITFAVGAPVTPPSAPVISGLSPNNGPVGTVVTITGSNFGTVTGSVTVNALAATITSWTDTTIVFTVPVGATSGNVVVANSVGGSNAIIFTVTMPSNFSFGGFTPPIP